MSTVAKQALVNAALAHLGEEPVADIATPTPSPKLAKTLAQLDGTAGVERWVLARHPWLDALTYDSLEPSTVAGNWAWTHVFELPEVFVKLWECSATAFQVGAIVVAGATRHVVFSNDASLDVSYTARRDFEAYGPDLAAAMAYELAARTAGPLQSNYESAQRLHKQALEMIAAAETGEAGQHGSDTAMFPSGLAAARVSGAF